MNLYSVDDYTRALFALLPTGLAWPRDVKSSQYATLRALGIHSRVLTLNHRHCLVVVSVNSTDDAQ
jgi:hypothetical protein